MQVVIHTPSGLGKCCRPGHQQIASPLAPCRRTSVVAFASRRRGAVGGGRQRQKGFGRQAPDRRAGGSEKALKELQDEDEDAGAEEVNNLRPEYQLYSDAEYKPQRYVNSVEVRAIEGRGRGLVATGPISPGDLVVVSPAALWLEGGWGEAPEPEALQLEVLESGGLSAAQRRVLDLLDDGTPGSQVAQASVATLDPRFWAARGRNDPQAPPVSSARLLAVLRACACGDSAQDGAAMMLRHQRPNGFIGLWPEFAMLNHSCVPNTSCVVVRDRMLIHASTAIGAGEELTRSYLGAAATLPAPQRHAALADAGHGFRCNCARCVLEENASEGVRDVLQAIASWYSEDAVPRFSAANAGEDLDVLRELLEEAQQLVEELEGEVDHEPGLSDEQRTLLRAAAYDLYDMRVLTGEFVNREKADPSHVLACLELLKAMAPGSEAHTLVALKYEALVRTRSEMMEVWLRQGRVDSRERNVIHEVRRLQGEAELAAGYFLDAYIARYGYVNLSTLESLREGAEMYIEGLEQVSLMEAEGKEETTTEYEINGVRVSVVDRAELSTGGSGADDVRHVREADGVKVMVLDEPLVEGAEEADKEEESVSGSGGHDLGAGEEVVGTSPEVPDVVPAAAASKKVRVRKAVSPAAGGEEGEAPAATPKRRVRKPAAVAGEADEAAPVRKPRTRQASQPALPAPEGSEKPARRVRKPSTPPATEEE